eukprot:IDg12532t1
MYPLIIKNVPLGEKMSILRYIDNDCSALEAAKKFSVSQETVSGIKNAVSRWRKLPPLLLSDETFYLEKN